MAIPRLISVPGVPGPFPKLPTVTLRPSWRRPALREVRRGAPWLFIGFSDESRFFILGFVVVLVLVVVVIFIRIPRWDHIGHGWPRRNTLGDAWGHLGSYRTLASLLATR